MRIEVSIDANDWDVLREQRRSLQSAWGLDCLAEPPERPYTYFPAHITIDGETIENAGIRKKGYLGTVTSVKPSLKLKLHEYVPDQQYSGMNRFTLNNCREDPSYVKQCIGYQVLTAAGVPAPRCNFARVWVNGEELGLYANVESIKKPFLARHFSDDTGNLYEGVFSDFRPDWVATFERKTNEEDPDRSDLDAVVSAAAMDDASVLAALEALIDVDAFLNFWAAEVLISHWDGYAGNTNNYYLYAVPETSRFAFIPWGADNILFPHPFLERPDSVLARGILARRFYFLAETRTEYEHRLRTLLDEVWDEDAIIAELDRMELLIAPIVDPNGDGQLADAVDEVRQYVLGRRAAITEELDAGGDHWTDPLRDPVCFPQIGQLAGTFATTWGTLGGDPLVEGSGTLSGTAYTVEINPGLVGAAAGSDENPGSGMEPGSAIRVVGEVGDGRFVAYVVVPERTPVTPGTPIPLNWGDGYGSLYSADSPGGNLQFVGLLMHGSVTFDSFSTTPGAAISGSFEALLLEWSH